MRDGRTDGRTDRVKPIYNPNNFVVQGYDNFLCNIHICIHILSILCLAFSSEHGQILQESDRETQCKETVKELIQPEQDIITYPTASSLKSFLYLYLQIVI